MIIVVGLVPLVSITVDAATYDLPYIAYIVNGNAGTAEVWVSDGEFHMMSSAKSSSAISDLLGIAAIEGTTLLRLMYNESMQQWQTAECIVMGAPTKTRYKTGSSYAVDLTETYEIIVSAPSMSPDTYMAAISIYTNCAWTNAEQLFVGVYSNDLTQLPQGLTEDAIRDLIDEQLNTQTESGAAAATIINNTTINYNSYVAGDITHTEMQQIVTDNLDQLSELSGAAGNTLSDLMQINNAITYNQSIQDQLHNTVSASTLDLINEYLAATNSDVYEYQNGTRDQQSATNSIRNRIRYLEARIVDGTINTTADIAAVQTAISTMQAALDSVIGYSDLSQEVSDKSQASDQAELDLLNEMVSVMQQEEIENPMQDQQTMADAVAVRDSISDIWINKYMLALSAMFGMLVIPCIILRTHYRMM